MKGDLRAFLGSELGEAAARAVAEVGRALREAIAPLAGWKVSWVAPEKLHMTLKFLGAISPERTKPVTDVVGAVCRKREPISTSVRRVGCFPPGRPPRVLWVGLDDERGRLRSLARDLDEGLAPLGFEARDVEFHPHVTLGRVRHAGRERIAALIGDLVGVDCGETRLDAVTLYRSDLRSGTYHVLERIPFGEGEPR